ncbi:toprim domain-containing protein [Hyunsoonleella pacifica]|uniref:DUF3991 domain-containing protein n=1 Tax=Hyunsoonleella pacifica TaxID=1080224 RepID=A0A4V2JAS2_9FLAO|nr:toprim domain-containing protein [Hyunsoonleella pacifica]TBN14398.1 hypothetical protein EYD46_12550 [Hyunsoonleella pacifica]GGD13410.1 hypothetical protein GCM10011368_14240 [Hyunsoonleella pacifica]
MANISYNNNPQHYKRLIEKINDEINFSGYLLNSGFKLLKKSAGSMEFIQNDDRIVVLTSRQPATYFNRNDSNDKGRFFKFIRQRSANFYEAVKDGLSAINRDYEYQEVLPEKPKSTSRSIEENYNIVALENPSYLVKERAINLETLNSNAFKGRVFNAYHFRDTGGRIPNIAFPKYDLNNKRVNYIIYNKPYKDKDTGEEKKFRLVLNKKDAFLFHSNFPKNGIHRIILGESGIDLLSFHELNGKEGDFYISLGGNIYQEKINFLSQLVAPIIEKNNVELVSAFDNDKAGHEYDVLVFTKMINQYAKDKYVECSFKNGIVELRIHYNQKAIAELGLDSKKIGEALTISPVLSKSIRQTMFSDKLMYEFNLQDLMKLNYKSFQNTNGLKLFMLAVNETFLPFRTDVLKSHSNDWNQDLMDSKKKVSIKK